MKKYLLAVLVAAVLLAGLPPKIYASYVLPYPSYLPGNKLYRLSRILDEFKRFWYWGSIGQFKYHLSLSDKYLVEAKTLFEYDQYLLAIDALNRSSQQFVTVPTVIEKAVAEGKDASSLKGNLREASLVHEKILDKLLGELPLVFVWKPEKTPESTLLLHEIISEAQKLQLYQ